MIEAWRKIQGYDNYSVSDHGRVRNDRTGRVLKLQQGQTGRFKAWLCRGGLVKGHFVHRLVLAAFVGECPSGMECCHNDGDETNNHVSNLRWDTHQSNMADKLEHGTHQRGERHGGVKLTEEQAYEIKFGDILGTQTEVGALFGVGRTVVCHIRCGRRWGWLKKRSEAA